MASERVRGATPSGSVEIGGETSRYVAGTGGNPATRQTKGAKHWHAAAPLRGPKMTIESENTIPATPAERNGAEQPAAPQARRRRGGKRRRPRPQRGERPQGGQPQPQRPPEEGTDPHRLARLFQRRWGTDAAGRLTLRHWGRGWWRYEDGRYQLLHDRRLLSVVTHEVKHEFNTRPVTGPRGLVKPVTTGIAKNVVNALGSFQDLQVPDDITQPAWLGEAPEDREYIAVENGLLDVRAFLREAPNVLRPHTPEWFSPVCLPYAFDPVATCPLWTDFIAWMFKHDPELIQFVQEWFGYCLVIDHSQHTFVILVGDGANGKSVMLDTLKNLVGRDNCSSVGLESFEGRFDPAMTIGKLVNIVSEIGDVGKLPEGKLKAFVGGDLMTFDRKFLEPLQVNPTARLVFATNKLPKFADRSEGIWRRFVPLPCEATVAPKDQDHELAKKLEGELSGIFNWALRGLTSLRARGRFNVPEASKRLRAEHRGVSHPELQFLGQECEERAGTEVVCQDLYHRYQEWCDDGGHTALSDGEFGKALKRRFPKVERKRRRREGKIPWVYTGLGCS